MKPFICIMLLSRILSGVCRAQQPSESRTRVHLRPGLEAPAIIASIDGKDSVILAEFVTLEALEAYLAKLPRDSEVKLVYESEAFFNSPSKSGLAAYAKAVDWFCYEHHIKFRRLVITPTIF